MNPRDIRIEEYNYPLPAERIAKHPLAQRDACKLLFRDSQGRIRDEIFSSLPSLLPEDSVLVYNNTRVINARLHFEKSTGAKIEIFCLEPASPADYERAFASRRECVWNVLVGNSKRWKDGALEAIVGDDCVLTARRYQDDANKVIFAWDNEDYTFSDIISKLGQIPIPPYLCRESEPSDSRDYQTVYSHIEGSVAAPTAGLHFTPEVLDAISKAGIPRYEVTLHVGAGTFRPVKSETIGEHDMHSEFITVPKATIASLRCAIQEGRHIVAVGTTTVRTLESLYHIGKLILSGRWDGEVPQWVPYDSELTEIEAFKSLCAIEDYLDSIDSDVLIARTRIIIAPGYVYRIVSGMVTNFHQPQSTLLLLVSAFLGGGWQEIYRHALERDYRFLSYGDACLFLK